MMERYGLEAETYYRPVGCKKCRNTGYSGRIAMHELLVIDGHLQWSLIHFWPGDAVSIRAAEPLTVGEWLHVTVSSDGSGRGARTPRLASAETASGSGSSSSCRSRACR